MNECAGTPITSTNLIKTASSVSIQVVQDDGREEASQRSFRLGAHTEEPTECQQGRSDVADEVWHVQPDGPHLVDLCVF